MSYLLNALAMLIGLAFDAAVALLLLRVLCEACRADFNNPLSQFVYRYTNPVLAPSTFYAPKGAARPAPWGQARAFVDVQRRRFR
jgi:uncharacterized protein YggT (Ycf19 family)